MMPLAKGDLTEIPTIEKSYCFSQVDIGHLASYKKSCDVCKLDLLDTKETLKKCVDHGAPASSWWSDPKIVISGFVVS